MKEIRFNTGRKYSQEGQIIFARKEGEFVVFDDITRGIEGKTTVPCDLNEKDIMGCYDRDWFKTLMPWERRL